MVVRMKVNVVAFLWEVRGGLPVQIEQDVVVKGKRRISAHHLIRPGGSSALRAVRRNQGRWSGVSSVYQAFWLIAGFLSHNDLDNADAYLRAARPFGNNPRLLNLEAILAYKRNDLARASTTMEAAVLRDRSAVNLYNLAVIRRASGDTAGAGAAVDEILRRHPASALVGLAGELTHPE